MRSHLTCPQTVARPSTAGSADQIASMESEGLTEEVMPRCIIIFLVLLQSPPLLAEVGARLALAAAAGRVYQVEDLLAQGADVNARSSAGRPALVMAAFYGNQHTLKLLLAAGADVNAADNLGNTSLMEAASQGHLQIVSSLLLAGGDVNQKNHAGVSVLDRAKAGGNNAVIEKLRKAGAIEDESESESAGGKAKE